MRKVQEASLLAESPDYADALAELGYAETALTEAQIERKRTEMLCSLTKAWLYSQGGKL